VDLKCYCTQDMYDNYRQGGILYACSPKMRKILFAFDGVKRHKDLNIRLSLDRRKHKIEHATGFHDGWFQIWKK